MDIENINEGLVFDLKTDQQVQRAGSLHGILNIMKK